eukprot:TCONS_00034213-protein
MSYEDVIKGLKVIGVVSLGTFAGSSLHTAMAVQPSLVEESNVPAASRIMRGMLMKSSMMPISALLSSFSSLALYFKLRATPNKDQFWLMSGSAMLSLMPLTIYYIGPINAQFRFAKEEDFEQDEEKWNGLLSDWLFYHRPRALLSMALFGVAVYKLVK